MQNIQVRKAQNADAQALVDLRQRVFEETDFMLWSPKEYKVTVQREQEYLERLSTSDNSICLVAYDADAMVGFLNAMGGEAQRQKHSAKIALAVSRSHWGRGVGRVLMQSVQIWARESGLARIELTVHVDNLKALGLYLKMGFEVEGVRRRSLRLGSRWIDEYQMAWLVPDV